MNPSADLRIERALSSGSLRQDIDPQVTDSVDGSLYREAAAQLADVSPALRVQSDQLRMKRRQRAERLANEAPIKMIFPLVLLIFPAFLAVILAPAVIRISETF